ncbi:MAG TPA: AAA family ATPase [Steroidobacteraceae bacterium]|nr:AAA family ATPase [Steroidobacteraceae bacterium]
MLQVSERSDERILHGGALPRDGLNATLDQLNRVILGKDAEIRLCVACLLARGHLLIEDIPGVGKTTLAHALAQTLGLSYQRIQFTSDLLPADIIGVSIFDRAGSRFEFQHGPIFAQLVLADEVNRATPKAQSALLEAMEEQQVTVDGRSHPLPEPFFVIATQNPSEQVGTFPLPESQLDRFLMRTELGYPDAAHERQLLMGQDRRALLATLGPRLTPAELATIQAGVSKVHTAPALLDYVQALVAHTRSSGRFLIGLSPRAAIGLLRASQSWALLAGRNSVLPEDVQAVLPAVVGHRLRVAGDSGAAPQTIGRDIIESVPIP